MPVDFAPPRPPPDRATMAAVASGWVMEETPDPLQPGLIEWIERWRESPAIPVGALWPLILDNLRRCGCLDAETGGCRQALALGPVLPALQLRLAGCLRRSGLAAEAIATLDAIRNAGPGLRADILLERVALGADPAATAAALDPLAMADGQWGAGHSGLVEALVQADEGQRAMAFIERWTERWPLAPERLEELGRLALLIGEPRKARALLQPLWAVPGGFASICGPFSGEVAPYDQAVEDRWAAAVEAALTAPEPPEPMPPPPVPPGLKALLVSFADRALPNDLAGHLAAAAADAGLALGLHLDAALATPDDFIGDDGAAARQVEALIHRLETERPDLVMVDCCAPLSLRGLNPGLMSQLKHRLGFRLACLMRDSHRYAMPLVRAWLPAADVMIADVLSPVFASDMAPSNAKVLPLSVPALHATFRDAAIAWDDRDLAMSFVGSINFTARRALLAVLLTEEIGLHAVTGAERMHQTPDMASYARLLGRSKAVLNISAHSPEDHLVTGRVWEAIAAGAVLVEQDNAATRRFFTPYRHYLPWRTVDDIVHIARFIDRRPDLARRVAAEAGSWAGRAFPTEAFWSAIVARALSPAEGISAEHDHLAALDWASQTIG